MAVSLTIDIGEVLKSDLVLNALSNFFKIDRQETVTRIFSLPPKKVAENLAEATAPTHVQFINPDDDRTSKVCRKVIDGKHIWPIGSDAIVIPPLHHRCRSSLSFIRV